MRTWFVASGRPGTSSFLEMDVVAVNFHVRAPVAGLRPEEIKKAAAGRDPTCDEKNPATRTLFANQLEQFASRIAEGDRVITFDPAARQTILVGRITGRYRYEDPSPVDGHPHLLPVEWLGSVSRSELHGGGAIIPSTRNITVRLVNQLEPLSPTPLDDAPEAPVIAVPAREPQTRTTRAPDGFSWDPPTGSHRYILTQTFRRSGSPERALLVVMLNPGTNNLPGFRRSTTCHAVRAWGEANGFDGAIYVNLFTHIEPNSARLRDVPVGSLNGPEADEVIRLVTERTDGPAIAGWGSLPPGINRGHYDRRVAEVRQLLGWELDCLGLTRDGYPRHGRGWRPGDSVIPLP